MNLRDLPPPVRKALSQISDHDVAGVPAVVAAVKRVDEAQAAHAFHIDSLRVYDANIASLEAEMTQLDREILAIDAARTDLAIEIAAGVRPDSDDRDMQARRSDLLRQRDLLEIAAQFFRVERAAASSASQHHEATAGGAKSALDHTRVAARIAIAKRRAA